MPAPRHRPVNRRGCSRSEHAGPGAAVAGQPLAPVPEGVVLRFHSGQPLDPEKAAGGADPPPARRPDPDRPVADLGLVIPDAVPARRHRPRAEALSRPAADRPLGDPRRGGPHLADLRRGDPRRGEPRSHRRGTRGLPDLGRTLSGLGRSARDDHRAGSSARDEVVPAAARGATQDLRRLRRGCRPRLLRPRSHPGPARAVPGQIQRPRWSRGSKWRSPLAKPVSR